MNRMTTPGSAAHIARPSQDDPLTVLAPIARLQTLTHEQLKERWRELYDAPPPVWNRPFLLRRLAYRIQELAFGGLPEATRQELERIAEENVRIYERHYSYPIACDRVEGVIDALDQRPRPVVRVAESL